MKKKFKKRRKIKINLIYLPVLAIIIAILPFFESQPKAEAEFFSNYDSDGIAILGENSLFPIAAEPKFNVVRKIKMMVTGYSSSTWETDSDPEITASGARTKEGIVANNFLPFGTKIRIPEIYGDEIFIVKDRMNWKKGNYHLDIWFPSYQEALNFGAKITSIEILENQIY